MIPTFLAPFVIPGVIAAGLFVGTLYVRESAKNEERAACKIAMTTLDQQWRKSIEAANKEADDRVKLAINEAQATPDAPTAPAELVRLCKSEPAGCRAIQP